MRTMLVAVDFSDLTPVVLKVAAEQALAGGYRVHLLHVLPEEADLVGYETGMQLMPPVSTPTNADNELMDHCRQELEGRGLEVTVSVVEGAPALEIVDAANELRVDLIVMGSHRHGLAYHLFLGSTSGGVLKRVHCPVLIVPAPAAAVPQTAKKQSASTETSAEPAS